MTEYEVSMLDGSHVNLTVSVWTPLLFCVVVFAYSPKARNAF